MLQRFFNLYLGDTPKISPVLKISRYDTDWQFVFTIYDGDELYQIPAGTTAILLGRKADKTVFAFAGTVDGNNIVVNCSAQVSSAEGTTICELRLSSGGALIGTCNFNILVEEAPLSGFVVSEDDFSALDQLVNQALVAAQETGNAAEAVAEIKGSVSNPFAIAKTAAEMTDHDKGYVYAGSEAGYTKGGWYYWSGSAWVLGGTSVDTTLAAAGVPAEAKATGDALAKGLRYMGNLAATDNLDNMTDIGYWACASAITSNFIGVSVSSIFFNCRIASTNRNFIQIFITARGEVYSRQYVSNTWSAFKAQNDFIRDNLSDPDTTAEPGFYPSPAGTTAIYTGESVYSTFLNLTNNSGYIYLQAFITKTGHVYARYGNTGDFVAGIVTDDTLTTSGAAADAKATGDRFNTVFGAMGISGDAINPTESHDRYLWSCRYNALYGPSSTYWHCAKFAVTPGEKLHIEGLNQGVYARLYAFYNSNDMSAPVAVGPDLLGETEVNVIVPAGANIVWVNGADTDYVERFAKPAKMPRVNEVTETTDYAEAYNYLFDRDSKGYVETVANKRMGAYEHISGSLVASQTFTGVLVKKTGGATTNTWTFSKDLTRNWVTYAYLVTAGQKLKISGVEGTSWTAPCYILASGSIEDPDSGSSYTTCLYSYYSGAGGRVSDIITIPDGATVFYVCGRTNTLPSVYAIETETDFMRAAQAVRGKMLATTVMDNLDSSVRGGVEIESGDWVIKWTRTTNNHVPNLKEITYKGNIIYTGNTDWIGPYAFIMANPSASQIGDYWRNTRDAYIVGDTPLTAGWLSASNGGTPLVPVNNAYYRIRTAGDYYDNVYLWDSDNNRYQKSTPGYWTTGGGHTLYKRTDGEVIPDDYTFPPNAPTMAGLGVHSNRCVSIKYYADGKEVGENLTVSCDTFKIVWVNRIQASNTIKWDGTGLECLEETCWAEFTGGGKIKVGVAFKPLVDIRMGWYSGMQAQIHYLYDPENVRSFDDTTAKMCYIKEWSDTLMEWARVTNDIPVPGGNPLPAYSTDKYDVIADVTVVGKYANLDMHMDRDYGIARLRFPQNEQGTRNYFYTGNDGNRKGYFSLVTRDYVNPMDMPVGTIWIWRGYYDFYPNDIDRNLLI